MKIENPLLPKDLAEVLDDLAGVEADLLTEAGDKAALEERAVTLRAAAETPVWIQLAVTGSFRGHRAGPFELNTKIFNEIIANFQTSKNKSIPIDYEHSSEQSATEGTIPVNGAPAQGWIRDLKIEHGNLYALVEWGAQAREQIRSGAYSFISPAIRFASVNRVTGKPAGARLTSAGLTNQPFLEMAPLIAGDRELAMALTDAHAQLAAESAQLTDVRAELSTVTTSLSDTTTKLSAAETEIIMLRAEKFEREESDLRADVALAFDTYKDSLKLTDARRTGMLSHRKSDPDGFKATYPPVAPSERHLLNDLTGVRPNGSATTVNGTNDEPIRLSLNDLAHQLSRQRGIPLGRAQLMAEKIINDRKARGAR